MTDLTIAPMEEILAVASKELERVKLPGTADYLRRELDKATEKGDEYFLLQPLGAIRYALALQEKALEYAKRYNYGAEVADRVVLRRLRIIPPYWLTDYITPKGWEKAKNQAAEVARRTFLHEFNEEALYLHYLKRAGADLRVELLEAQRSPKGDSIHLPVWVGDGREGVMLEVFYLEDMPFTEAVTRLLSEPPASWDKERLEAARHLAVQAVREARFTRT
ncbi:hypothetical protein [Thermus caliditerrae]|uniref:hypothetical protein n=1 Tax=Thermus caliditerrae TaxID=1330700 RepID=UPI001F224323|nr:hypothetical protein [Thermus caliditerrae]